MSSDWADYITKAEGNNVDVMVRRNSQFKQCRATQNAAKIAGCEDAERMKNMRQPDRPDVERILVGQNAEKLTR